MLTDTFDSSMSNVVVTYCAMKECLVLCISHTRTCYIFPFVLQYLVGVLVALT